jgi:hypothetical protein
MGGPKFVVLESERVPDAPSELPSVEASNLAPTQGVPRSKLHRRQAARDRDRASRGLDIGVADPAQAPESIPEDANADADDLAAVVVRKTNRLLASGKLEPTLRDGLTAQQLLDRRAEKAADRRFMLNLAMAMAGGGAMPPQKYLPESVSPPEEVVEGEFEEVELAPAHLRKA